MRLTPNAGASRLREYNHAHDPKNGEFTTSVGPRGATVIGHPGTPWTAHVNTAGNGFKVHTTMPAGVGWSLAGTRAGYEEAINMAKDFVLRSVRGAGVRAQVEPAGSKWRVSSTNGHNVLTTSPEKAHQIHAKILSGQTTGDWLHGLL